MAYTPINWQTGDTITAEKMNKMDNGWSISSTQLFSETVTTEDDGYGYISAELTYTQQITAKTITVTFNGVTYECKRGTLEGGAYYYGEQTEDGAGFDTYPFFIYSEEGYNTIQTETVGTYTVTVIAHDFQLSSAFTNAVGSAVTLPDVSTLPFHCIEGETNGDDIENAFNNGRLLYFYHTAGFLSPAKLYIITDTNLAFIPEDSTISVGYDSDGIFTVTNV